MTQRIDQPLSGEFRKDETFERIIESLNESLFQGQQNLLQDKGHLFPTLHILGAPRSGTTLVSQILASHLPIGYINNLIAAFWKAPIYGVELSKGLLGGGYKSSFHSNFGRTDDIREPHEFGYFWNHHLRYGSLQQLSESHESTIDWKQLALVLNNMTYHFNAPIAFKSFLFGFHAAKAVEWIPKTCFVYIKRDFIDNALSILKLRQTLNGDEAEWGSIKPIQYGHLKTLSVHEQIAGQILCMEHEYLKQLDKIPDHNKLCYYYEDLCKDPAHFLRKIGKKLEHHNSNILVKSTGEIKPFTAKVVERDKEVESVVEKFNAARERIKELFPNLREWNGNK